MQHRKIQTYFKYLPLSPELLAWGLHVLDAGMALIPPEAPYPPSDHPEDHDFTWEKGRILPSYSINYISQGGGVFESVASGPQTVRAGDVFILFPGIWHRYRPNRKTGWTEHWIEFSGDLAHRMMKHKIFSIEHPILHPGDDQIVQETYASVLDAIRQGEYGYEHWIASQAVRLIARLVCITRDESALSTFNVMQRAQHLIVERLAEPLDLETLSRELKMSYSLFRKRFKQFCGLPPLQFQLQMRLNKACRMLINSQLSIGQIAQVLGFDSVYYFSRVFKEKMHCTPSEYRKKGCVRVVDEYRPVMD